MEAAGTFQFDYHSKSCHGNSWHLVVNTPCVLLLLSVFFKNFYFSICHAQRRGTLLVEYAARKKVKYSSRLVAFFR